jgi:hypothetical protein
LKASPAVPPLAALTSLSGRFDSLAQFQRICRPSRPPLAGISVLTL